jgi:hypothetical protein
MTKFSSLTIIFLSRIASFLPFRVAFTRFRLLGRRCNETILYYCGQEGNIWHREAARLLTNLQLMQLPSQARDAALRTIVQQRGNEAVQTAPDRHLIGEPEYDAEFNSFSHASRLASIVLSGDPRAFTYLHCVIKMGALDIEQWREAAWPNAANDNKSSLLHLALQQPQMILFLLDVEAEIEEELKQHQQQQQRQHQLESKQQQQQPQYRRRFLTPQTRNDAGLTPLMSCANVTTFSAHDGIVATLRILAAHPRTDLSAVCPAAGDAGRTALQIFYARNAWVFVHALLEKVTSWEQRLEMLSARDPITHLTPIIAAATSKSAEASRLLSVCVEMIDPLCCCGNNVDNLARMRRRIHGAFADSVTGATPVHAAIKANAAVRLAPLLALVPFWVNEPDAAGVTPFVAALSGCNDAIQVLIDAGANVPREIRNMPTYM